MIAILLGLYLLGCVLVGFVGRNGRLGFFGHFFLGLAFTPFGDLLVQALATRAAQKSAKSDEEQDSESEQEPKPAAD